MADEVRLWSDELARDPSSLVFLPLADSLRKQGQLELAQRVAARGLARHPDNADAHDALARIHADRGELDAAFAEWETVRRLDANHTGALKGMAFVRFQQGRLADAEQLLMQAHADGLPDGETGEDISAAIDMVRRSSGEGTSSVNVPDLPRDPHLLFADLLAEDQAAMMLDRDGLVLAGAYYSAEGDDVAPDIGASLSGVSDEALRATRHLSIGAWRSILFETEAAVVSLSPSPGDGAAAGGLIVVAASPSTPLGLLRRLADRCVSRASSWLNAELAGGA